MSLKQELLERWLLYQFSSDEIFEKLEKWNCSFYCGFDPTADSLHMWNYIGFLVAVHLMKYGNKYIALTWWATGMIWDPGWKNTEREFLDENKLESNQRSIMNQIQNILAKMPDSDKYKYLFKNNKEFYENMNILTFLRDVWKYITVNNMISKDTVKSRIEDPNKSISYTEFSYMLLQWYDFYHLYKKHNVQLQIWWQDQWWNLVTWTEIIKKKDNGQWYALTWPLITDSNWKKFWKSEWNALWLDKRKTTPYKLYQYFINTDDNDVERYLKMLTLLDLNEINELIKNNVDKSQRLLQKRLAFEVVKLIHWEDNAIISEKVSNILFNSEDRYTAIKSLDNNELNSLLDEVPNINYFIEHDFKDLTLFWALVKLWFCKTNTEARNLMKWNSIYVNNVLINSPIFDIREVIKNNWLVMVQKWKKNFWIIYFNECIF